MLLYIRLVYCIPSIVLYITVVILLHKEKQRLFGSFYSLLIVQAITNIFVFINSFYLVQLANETNENSLWSIIYMSAPDIVVRIPTEAVLSPTIIYVSLGAVTRHQLFQSACLGTHFAFVQIYMIFFISLNRMTFIVHSGMDERIWKVAAPACAAVAYLSPFAATYSYLTNSASWAFSSECHCFFTVTEANSSNSWEMLLIFLCVFLFLSSTVNVVSVVFLCNRTKRIRCTHLERTMLIVALLNFLIECSYSILFVLIYISPYIGFDSSVSLALIPYASDVMTLSTPYLIVILNRSIRSRLFRMFKCFGVIPVWGITVGADGSNESRSVARNSRISHNSVSGVLNVE